jgi:hypothetical protein
MTAMGLAANIPAIEAAQSLVMAKAIGIAFGNAKLHAECVYLTTGSGRLAQRVEIAAQRAKAQHG